MVWIAKKMSLGRKCPLNEKHGNHAVTINIQQSRLQRLKQAWPTDRLIQEFLLQIFLRKFAVINCIIVVADDILW